MEVNDQLKISAASCLPSLPRPLCVFRASRYVRTQIRLFVRADGAATPVQNAVSAASALFHHVEDRLRALVAAGSELTLAIQRDWRDRTNDVPECDVHLTCAVASKKEIYVMSPKVTESAHNWRYHRIISELTKV